MFRNIYKITLLSLLATLYAVACGVAVAQTPADATLASTSAAKVTTSEYEASILRIPEKDRFGWAMSQERIVKEIESLLRVRSVAEEARKVGLDADPVIKTRVKQFEERLLAEALAAKIDAESMKEFEAKQAIYLARAREQYLINKPQYQIPPETKASHIMVRISGRSVEEALAKANAIRARVLAGESFEKIAEAESDDPTARQNQGQLGFFGPGQMDSTFEAAANALTKPGELSEPVRSQFGYHIIRFEDRRPARSIPFEDAKPGLMDKLKAQFLQEKQSQVLGAMFDPRKIEWNEPAVISLKKTVDPALLKSIEK